MANSEENNERIAKMLDQNSAANEGQQSVSNAKKPTPKNLDNITPRNNDEPKIPQNNTVEPEIYDLNNQPTDSSVPFGEDADPYISGSNQENKTTSPRTARDLEDFKNNQLGTAAQTDNGIAGGRAQEARRNNAVAELNPSSSTQAKTTSKIQGAVDQGKNALENAGKNLSKKFSSTAIKAGAKAAASAIWAFILAFWPYILAGIVILVAIIFLVMAIARKNTMPSGDGKTTYQPADPISDKDWINKVLMFSGDTDVTKEFTETFLNGLKNDLTNLRTQVATNPETVAKIDDLLEKIKATIDAKGNEKTKLALELKAGILEIAGLYYYVAPISNPAIKTQTPFVNNSVLIGDISSGGFNPSAHLGTPGRPCPSKNSKICWQNHRTFIKFLLNTCDATDINADVGTEVRPVVAGVVTELSSKHIRIKRVEGSETIDSVYAHLDFNNDLKVGSKVGLNTSLGKVVKISATPHLHFELMVNNKCVVGTKSDVKSATGENKIGKIIWLKMARVLNLN